METPVPNNEKTKPLEERILFSWESYTRPFERKSREFYLNSSAILAVISLIIFIAEGWVPVVLLIALSFLYFTLHNIEPEKIKYEITNVGIRIKDQLITWDNFTNFWIEEKKNYNKLVLGTLFTTGKIELVTEKEDKEKIESAISKYLIKQIIPPSSLEKIADWFSSKIQGN